MNSFFKITQSFNTTLLAKGFRVVTLGDTYKTDIARQTIMPYAHIIPNTSSYDGQTTTYDFTIVGMDLVDFTKDDLRDEQEPFYSTDNLQDVLNDIHNRLVLFLEQYKRGSQNDLLIKYVDSSLDAFFDRHENLLAGWTLSFTVEVPTASTIC